MSLNVVTNPHAILDSTSDANSDAISLTLALTTTLTLHSTLMVILNRTLMLHCSPSGLGQALAL